MYLTLELSQLMLNLYVVSRTGSFLRHAIHMLSLCEYYNLCGFARDKSLLFSGSYIFMWQIKSMFTSFCVLCVWGMQTLTRFIKSKSIFLRVPPNNFTPAGSGQKVWSWEESNPVSPYDKPTGKPLGLCHGRDESLVEVNAGV